MRSVRTHAKRALLVAGCTIVCGGTFAAAGASAATQGFYVYNFTGATLRVSSVHVEGPEPVFEPRPAGSTTVPPRPETGDLLRPGHRFHVELISKFSIFQNENRRLVDIKFTEPTTPEAPSGRDYAVIMETGDANFVTSSPSQTDMRCVVRGPHRCPVVGTTTELLDPLTTQTRQPGLPPAKGDLFVADTDHNRVVEVNPDGSELIAGSGLNHPSGVALNAKGDLFIADSDHNRVVEVPAHGGGQTTVASGLDHPMGVATDAEGDLFIADTRHDRVLEVPAGGGPERQVGPAMFQPLGMAVDQRGNLFVTTGPDVVEVPANGAPEKDVVRNLDAPVGVAVDARDDLYVSIRGDGLLIKVPDNGAPKQAVLSGLSRPNGLALHAGHLFVADANRNRVLEVPAGGGEAQRVANGLNRPFAVAVFAG